MPIKIPDGQEGLECLNCKRVMKFITRGYCSNCYQNLMKQGVIEKIFKPELPKIFTNIQQEILNGFMLGDGSLVFSSPGTENPRLCMCRKGDDVSYLFWQYEQFKEFYSNEPKIRPVFDIRTNKTYQSATLLSRLSPLFKELREKWYPNNKKSVNKKIQLTPFTLLIWFLDDGCIIDKGNKLYIKFSTDGFTKSDVKFLQELLNNFTNEHFTISKNGKNFILQGATMAAISVINIIDPIFLSCMERKRTWKNFDFKYVKENPDKFGQNGNRPRLYGGVNNNAKLNWDIVKAIRNDYETNKMELKDLAKKYNMTGKSNICSIIHYKAWIE